MRPSLFKVCNKTLDNYSLAVRLLITGPGVWGGGEGPVLFDTLQQMERDEEENE